MIENIIRVLAFIRFGLLISNMKRTTQYLILIISFAIFACNGNKDQGDYNRGYTAGYAAGKAEKVEEVKVSEIKKSYKKGFLDGFKEGMPESLLSDSIKVDSIKTPVIVPLQDIKRMILKIYYEANEWSGGISSIIGIENCGVATNSDWRSIGEFIEKYQQNSTPTGRNKIVGYFFATDIEPVDNGKQCLVVLRDYWGEGYSSHIISLFDTADDLAVLQGFLSETYGEYMGGVVIIEMIKLSSDSYLLVFRSGGGDAGDKWGSTWFSYWKKPFDLKELYKKSYEIQQEETDSIYIEKVIDYSLTADSMVAHVVLKERKRYYPPNVSRTYNNSKTTEWVVLESDTVDLANRIKRFDPDFKSPD